jgi:hypothetical protein
MAKKRSDYDHGFDLGQFRHDAAAFVKLVIQARAKKQPTFLSEADYRRWGLEKIADDARTIEFLLAQAEQQHDKIWRTYIGPHGSGGADPNDPLAELKQDIAFFANWDVKLREVINKVRAGKQVKWQGVAHWDRLSAIRDHLDALPHPQPRGDECSEWSKPKGPQDWARVFGVSRDTMRKMLQDQTVRNRQLSPRRYCICVDDLPPKAR